MDILEPFSEQSHEELRAANEKFLKLKLESLQSVMVLGVENHNDVGNISTLQTANSRDFQKEEDMRDIYADVLYDFYQRGMTEVEIAQKFNLSQYKISRIVNGKVKLENIGRPGPNAALTNFAEVMLGLGIHKLVREGLDLSYSDICEYAKVLWRAENPYTSKPAPAFGKNWRRGFNRRHRSLALTRRTIRAKDKRRFDAAIRSNVNSALQGIKHIIGGKIESKRVFTMDEVDVSANEKTAGHKGVTVGKVAPMHMAPKDTPHITSCIFLGLNGQVVSHSVIAACMNAPPGYDGSSETLQRGIVVRNSSGGVNISDGSFFKVAEAFVEEIYRGKHHLSDADFPVYLIMDGCSVHSNDVQTLEYLKKNRVKVIRIAANLTSVIQVNDNKYINGRLQGSVRGSKCAISRLNGGKILGLEERIEEIDGLVCGLILRSDIVQAAKSIGFEYGPDFTEIWLTDDSISRALDKLEQEGVIRSSNASSFNSDHDNVLRNVSFMLVNRLVREGILSCHVIGLSEKTVFVAEGYSDKMIQERTGKFTPKRQRRQRYCGSKVNVKSSTVLLNDVINLHEEDYATNSNHQADISPKRIDPLSSVVGPTPTSIPSSEQYAQRLALLEKEFPKTDQHAYIQRKRIQEFLNGNAVSFEEVRLIMASLSKRVVEDNENSNENVDESLKILQEGNQLSNW